MEACPRFWILEFMIAKAVLPSRHPCVAVCSWLPPGCHHVRSFIDINHRHLSPTALWRPGLDQVNRLKTNKHGYFVHSEPAAMAAMSYLRDVESSSFDRPKSKASQSLFRSLPATGQCCCQARRDRDQVMECLQAEMAWESQEGPATPVVVSFCVF